jgi:hypothetical protein
MIGYKMFEGTPSDFSYLNCPQQKRGFQLCWELTERF